MPRVLIIDDDLISREVVAMLIRSLPIDSRSDISSRSAESGEQALAMLRSSSPATALPDIILLDAQMPGLSGVQLIRALRSLTHAPIAVMSASPISASLRAACDTFLLKPIRIETLSELLRDLPSSPTANVTDRPAIQLAQTAESTPSAPPFLDPVIFAKLKSMMKPAAVRQMYAAMADDMESRLAALEAAIHEQDAAEVARTAHAIKGGCAMLGLLRARNAAASLERDASQTVPVTTYWAAELAELQRALLDLRKLLHTNSFPKAL